MNGAGEDGGSQRHCVDRIPKFGGQNAVVVVAIGEDHDGFLAGAPGQVSVHAHQGVVQRGASQRVRPQDGAFGPYTTVEMIEAKAPGTLADLKEKIGPAKDATFSVKGRKETLAFVGDAIADFENSLVKDADKRPLDKDGNPMLYKWAGSRNIGE